MEANRQVLQKNEQQIVINLYDKYAAMLLGFINEIVNNHQLAEQCLVTVFKEIAKRQDSIMAANNTWCELQRLAKTTVAELLNKSDDYKNAALAGLRVYKGQSKFIELMNGEQKHIFCSIYYDGKTTAQLALEMNKTEAEIRVALKGAFAIIRKGREN